MSTAGSTAHSSHVLFLLSEDVVDARPQSLPLKTVSLAHCLRPSTTCHTSYRRPGPTEQLERKLGRQKVELDSKSPELCQERQPWVQGVKSPVGFRVVLKDDAGNCRQVIRAAWRQRAPVSSQSSRGSQNLLDPVGGRLHTVCCWLHQKRRVRPSESIWEFPPFIFPWTLTTFQKATSLNTVFWVCSPICLLLSYALLLGTTLVSAASLARSLQPRGAVWLQHRARYQ